MRSMAKIILQDGVALILALAGVRPFFVLELGRWWDTDYLLLYQFFFL